mmetsp:Transcript_109166/g.178237  ORF Transcript_109166/g.178237 Transcript_109166/m.178237 type:complete len:256 (+) Transcript_109166:102-869(+)
MARSYTLAILIAALTISEAVSIDIDGICMSDQCDSSGMTAGASKSGAIMLQVSKDSNGHRLATTEWSLVGGGQCTDADGMLVETELGWSHDGLGAGDCASLEDCKQACSEESLCAAINYYQGPTGGWCWMYQVMDTPYTTANGVSAWYECYVKGATSPEVTTAPPTLAPTLAPGLQPGECDPQLGMTVPLEGRSPGPYDKKFTGVQSVDKCMKKCKAKDTCKAMIYTYQQVCFRLTRKYDQNYKESSTSLVSNKC